MDALDHMLTDPLDSGVGNNGRVTEECMLGNCRVSLPEDLLEDPELFFSVLSESTWSEVLTDDQRQHLRQLLPQFPEDNTTEQDRTIKDLFNNNNFCFGNPLSLAQKLFRDGHFNPEVVKYRQLCAKSQRKHQLNSLQQYYHKLLKQILVSRKELLELAGRSGPGVTVKRRYPAQTPSERQEQRVRGRVSRILREVKAECGDNDASSGDEGESAVLSPSCPSSPTPRVSVRVLPSLYTQDMKTTDKSELGEKDMRAMLRKHREKRKRQPDHPDLMTSDIHLGDIMSRVNIGRKGSMLALFELALPKRKMREERRKKKMRAIKVESEEPCENLVPSEAPVPSTTITATLPDASVKEEPMEEVQNSPVMVEEIAVSFFNLLENILRIEGLASTAMLEEKVQQWQTSPASSLNPWFSSASCWSEMVLPALHFLAGETKGERRFSALLKHSYHHPLHHSIWTDFVVRPSTGDERRVFQVQEQQRYDQPHKAFTFRMHGFESVVGPVKGVFDKEMSLNKAREHTLLRSDRPAYVTILSLVRDAAARLPNGEGTRAEICELLKDSQFLAPDVTSAQVNTVVSGALDRLHYEKDPCVKYDIGRKLWIYLHRDRSQEEFGECRGSHVPHHPDAQHPRNPHVTARTCRHDPHQIRDSRFSQDQSRVSITRFRHGPSHTVTSGSTNVLLSPPLSVLLVSPPPMPQLGTLLSSSQVSQAAPSQPPARVMGHQAGSLSQVRVVSAQTAGGQQATLVHQTPHQIRVPVTMGAKGITQAVVSLPLRTQSAGSPIQVQAARGQTSLSMSGLTTAVTVAKPPSGSPGSPAQNPVGPAILQGVTSQNILKQVAITGQLGMKAQGGAGIPITATNLRIQGKDVLRLPPSSITTDAKGQTVLRITPDMMATLTKSPVTTVKLTPDMLGTATTKSISATLHVTPPHHSNTSPATSSGDVLTGKGSAGGGALLKASGDTIRLMPTLAVTMADQKTRTFSSVSSSDAKSGTTIRIMPGLGVIPQKQGQTITMTATTGSKPVSTGAATVTIATGTVGGAKGVTLAPSASGALTLGTATATVRQVPVTATVVSTQPGKIPGRITVPLSVLSQPMKSKSVMTTPILKGNISTNISSLGRNIILTTMPAGTKLIAGNKPVSFVTAQQLQQLQQQGQATQVRIHTVPAQQLQQRSAAGSPKSVSTVMVTTAPSPKRTPDPPPPTSQ
uniref:DEUBAD domain-containing protein n=1 Tax=Esox lucius TaxID=8010 RepID=A0AAY5KST1_ESOLU